MMSQPRAQRLARRAARRRPDGSPGPLARRALRVLAGRGQRGDQNAAGAVWQAWLAHPDDELWQALARWRGPQALAKAAFRAGTDVSRDAAARAAVGGFCTRHGLVPDDQAERAMFYVLTGQEAQYRAADPDGSLLALAYRAAGEAAKDGLRKEIASAGHLDVVRVVTGAAAPWRMVPAELRYVTGQLAGRREWDRLWQLVRDVSLPDALTAMPLFDQRWRPAGDRDRALFTLLASADPGVMADASHALRDWAWVAPTLRGTSVTGSFAPDGRRMTVASRDLISVFALPGMSVAEEYPVHGGVSAALDLGDAVIACISERGPAKLTAYAEGSGRVLLQHWGLMRLAPHPEGFVVLQAGRGLTQWHRAFGHRLQVRAADGRLLGNVSLPVVLRLPPAARGPHVVAADPGTGRIMLGGHRLWILDPHATRVLGSCGSPGPIVGGTWIRGDRIAAELGPEAGLPHRLAVFRVRDSAPELEAVLAGQAPSGWPDGIDLAADPLRGEIAVLTPGRWIEYFREQTLASVEGVLFTVATQFWVSPDGRYHVLVAPSADAPADDVTVVVHNQLLTPVASVRARPMAALGPPDLAAAITARDAFAGTPPSPFLDLFAACLEHRFGTDVGINRSAPEIGDDEIGISRAIGGRG
jgi:hypothetical protein